MKKRIIVIGELNVDLIVSGLSGFPSLGQEILARDLRLVLGGSSAICAAGLARLGTKVDFLGKIGKDDYGRFIAEELRRLGVGTRHLIHDSAVRTGITISLTYPKDRALITYLGCISEMYLEEIDLSILQRYQHLHVGSYFLQEGLQAGLAELFHWAHLQGLTVSLDTGYDPADEWGDDALLTLLDRVDIFLPNEEEACSIARADDTVEALRQLARRARLVVVKRGTCGAMSLCDEEVIHSPAFQIEVVDTTGAGDSFNAGFLYAHLVLGLPLEGALRFANACGALSTTGIGGTAAQPTLEQVLAFLESRLDGRL